jgi:hypothetical protein
MTRKYHYDYLYPKSWSACTMDRGIQCWSKFMKCCGVTVEGLELVVRATAVVGSGHSWVVLGAARVLMLVVRVC